MATVLVARGLGIDWRSSSLLAAMMNCRGLTELIVLNVGLSAGLLNQKLFTIFTIMTIVTTVMTGPVLDLIAKFGARSDDEVQTSAGLWSRLGIKR